MRDGRLESQCPCLRPHFEGGSHDCRFGRGGKDCQRPRLGSDSIPFARQTNLDVRPAGFLHGHRPKVPEEGCQVWLLMQSFHLENIALLLSLQAVHIKVRRIPYPPHWKAGQRLSKPPQSLGDQIRKHRLELHWLQADLAKVIGVYVVSVSDWERGTSTPSRRKSSPAPCRSRRGRRPHQSHAVSAELSQSLAFCVVLPWLPSIIHNSSADLNGCRDDVRTYMRKAERAAALIYAHFRKEFGLWPKNRRSDVCAC